MRFTVPRALLAALALLLLTEIFVIAPRFDVAALIVAGGLMIWPGVALARRTFAHRDPRGIAAWLIGPMLGLGFSVFGVFLLWAAGLQNWAAILLGPSLTWVIAMAAKRFGGPSLRLPMFDRRDVIAVTLALFLVPLVTFAPYDHVREPVAEGEAYRAYFTADFFWAMTVSGEVSKGLVPPRNPFLREEPLHYYWMAHFLSGALLRNVEPWGITVEQVVLVDGLLFGVSFVAFMYGLARLIGVGPWLSLLAVAAGFLANSYEGADMIRSILERGQPLSDVKNINIDAVTRWFYRGMPVDGLQRLLLYQPHHLTGYALALSALWLASLAEDVTETAVSLWAGILLGLALLFSTFSAMMVGLAVGLVFVLRLTEQRAWKSVVACALLGGSPIAVGLGVTNALGYTDTRYGSLLQLGLNPVALEHAGRVLFLSFGPLLFGGLAALARPRWMLGSGAAPTALTIVAFAFYFFANVPDSGNVWVGWRSGHMLLIAFAITGASAMQAAWMHQWTRPVLAITVPLALLLAVPMVAIDIYNAQDVSNRNQGPDFPWTLVITPEEREGLEWIRHSTPPQAVVQVEPYIRGSKHWAYIPAFAQRQSAAGAPIAMIPVRPYREAADSLNWGVFRANTPEEAHAFAKFLGVNYLVFGRVERRAYARAAANVASRPALFAPVFRNEEMAIFRVE